MEDLKEKFEEVYKTNYSKVMRLCLGYTNGDVMLSKDLTQEVFIKIWENLKSFRNESSISTWIYRITINTCLLSIREKKKVNTLNDLSNLKTDDSETEDNEQKLHLLYNCINTLNKESKSILLLELEGLPQKEIADIVGLSHEAIRVRIHRIKNELTKCVKK